MTSHISLLNFEIIDGLKELQANDVDLMVDLLQMFKVAGAEDVEKIRQAIEAKNHEDLQSVAHSLKSSAANLGASKMSELCHELEMHGRQEDADWTKAASVLHDLESTYHASFSALSLALAS